MQTKAANNYKSKSDKIISLFQILGLGDDEIQILKENDFIGIIAENIENIKVADDKKIRTISLTTKN